MNIVLVHGAFADASCWSKVIPALAGDGHNVTAVQNPLTSFDDDVATTRRVIDAQSGPTIVVGHSYGGAVITTAAKGANVKAPVYVAAFAPDEGEIVGALLEQYPTKLGAALRPDAAGFLYIDRGMFKEAFADDVDETERIVMAATQKPIKGEIFGHQFGSPAWKDVPCWYMVAAQDNAIHPDLERHFASRMGATTKEVSSSHVPFMSQPDAVIDLIRAAVG